MSDLISRQAAIDLVRDVCNAVMSGCNSHYDSEVGDEVYDDIIEVNAILTCNKEVRKALKGMPSAQQDCTECAEYDNETHSCPKYCDVIRQTLAEAKPERTDCNNCNEYDNEMKDCPHYCEVMRSTEDGLQIEAHCNKRKLPEEVQEPTWEQVKEYCKKRCLALITAEAYYELTCTTQPERKTGRWIIKDNPGTGWYRITCSECGEDVTSTAPCIGFYPNAKVMWNYCPDCGADMRGKGEK